MSNNNNSTKQRVRQEVGDNESWKIPLLEAKFWKEPYALIAGLVR